MTALIDWRDDASLPTRTFSWSGWAIVIALTLVVATGTTVALVRSASAVTDGACRLREASQGIPQLDTSGVAVGQQLPPHWAPGPRVRVRYAEGDSPSGFVLDATTCLTSDPAELTVVVAR
jgi:hypothetical protein